MTEDKNIKNYIPGFRSDTTWKKVIAIIYFIITLFLGDFSLTIFGFAAPFFIFSVISLIKTRKSEESKKSLLIVFAVSFVLLITGAKMNSGDTKEVAEKETVKIEEENDKKKEAEKEKKEREEAEKEKKEKEEERKKEEAERKKKEEEKKEEEKGKENEEEDAKEEIKEVGRESEIETAIRNRINDGDYGKTTIERITINEDLGTDDSGDYIALVYLDFNTMNREKTANEMMKMYSGDLVATLAKQGITDISQAVIFWEDEYNDRNLKYAYEYKDGGFYATDVIE